MKPPEYLTELNWPDIVFPNILPLLSIQDWFSLRCVSRDSLLMVESFLNQNKRLDLSQHKLISETAFQILTNSAESLRHLNLTGCKVATNTVLQALFKSNPLLSYVNLSDCHQCSAGVLQTLTVRNRNVRHLILEGCHWVTRDSIEYHSFHQGLNGAGKLGALLTEVNFTGCWELTDSVLVDFLSRFQNLQIVELGKIYSLTDHTMRAIATYTRDLRFLNLQGCWRISDSGLRLVAEYCKQLTKVSVADCRGISEQSLAKLRERNIAIDRRLDITLRRMQELRLEYNYRLQV